MLENGPPDLDEMLGGLMSPQATARPATDAAPPQFTTVAQSGAASASPVQMPSVPQSAAVQQAHAVASTASQFTNLYGVSERDTAKEYAEALGEAMTASLVGSAVENTLLVGGSAILERLQQYYGVDEAEGFDLMRRALILATTGLVDDLLERRIGNKNVAAEIEYRRNLIRTAVAEINRKEGRGATVASILNRVGRRRWSGDAVQTIIDGMLDNNELVAIAPELGPGRKSIRYAVKADS